MTKRQVDRGVPPIQPYLCAGTKERSQIRIAARPLILPVMTDSDFDQAFLAVPHKPPAMLSIAKHRHALLYLIENHPVTIVVAETSAGKSTQIPQYLEDAGWCTDDKLIGITQVSGRQLYLPDSR